MQNGDAYINQTGNSGLAKGGSGDVLAGMLSAFLAQGFSPENAAVCAVYYHGLAADLLAEKTSEYGMTPTDLLNELPFLYNKFNGG
jgi:NAD(P)H-hydrate epimerase